MDNSASFMSSDWLGAFLTNQLNNANNAAINAAQTQTLLQTMGKWQANAPAAAG